MKTIIPNSTSVFPVVAISLGLFVTSIFVQYGMFEEFPRFPYFDEVYTVPASKSSLANPNLPAMDHPPLVLYLMQLSTATFGDSPESWRLPSRLCGALILVAVFVIGIMFTGNIVASLFGALILFADGLYLTLSRAALWETPYVCFGLFGVLFALLGARQRSVLPYLLMNFGSSIALGLAVASKWTGLLFLVPVSLIVLVTSYPNRFIYRFFILGGMVLSTLVIYTTICCSLRQLSPEALLFETIRKFTWHVSFPQPHRYASEAWTWPLLLRPIWFGYTSLGHIASDGTPAVRGTLCLGNPAVFLLSGASSLYLLILALKNSIKESFPLHLLIPLTSYLVGWLPWLLLPVRKGFIYYFFPSLVFSCIGLSVVSSLLFKTGSSWKWISGASLILCGAILFFLAPVYFGIPTSRGYLELILVPKSWW